MIKDKPLVSVVIPTYNSETFITECINSILAQSYKNIEIIIIDDCSTDKTEYKINNNHNYQLKYIKLNKNNGSSIRIGVNAGSLEKKILEKYKEPNADAMVESALDNASLLQDNDFHNFKIIWDTL